MQLLLGEEKKNDPSRCAHFDSLRSYLSESCTYVDAIFADFWYKQRCYSKGIVV